MPRIMKRIMSFLSFIVTFVMSSTAQIEDINVTFIDFFCDGEKKEIFKGQVLKGKRNGMGILAMKNGGVYIGDFYRNGITGYGMFIVPKGKFIEHCYDCSVYVGNFKDGKKSGTGCCYNANGDLIHQGKFENDKPESLYPKISSTDRCFSVLKLTDKNTFFGEIKNGKADGYGVVMFGNRDLWLSNFRNGEGKGVGLYLMNDGEWQTVNFANGTYNVISSSTNYRNIDIARKESFRRALSGVLEILPDITNAAIGVANSIHNLQDGQSHSHQQTANGTSVNNSSSQTRNSNVTNNISYNSVDSDRNAKWMTANYQTQKAVYSNYESQLINMSTYPSKYNESQKKDIQAKMKNIRETIVSHGGTCQKSKWETW